MLSSERTMNVDSAPRYTWGNDDWDRVASELQRLHSDWRTHTFTMSEFEDAMETVITQEHQRTFMSMDDVMPHIFMAFARRSPVSGKAQTPKSKATIPVPVNSVGAIRWSPDEWEQVVLALHQLAPRMFEGRCATLSSRDIRAAQSVLPKSRHREPNQIEIYRKQLLKTWDALPADVRDPRLQERKIVDFPSGPVMEPPKQKSDNSSAIAIAMHKGFQAPDKPVKEAKQIKLGKVKQKRHSYDATDWLNIAREMFKQNPHAPYFTSAFQTVDLPALRAAQRVIIPIERRRTIVGNYGLAKPLVAAFKALKEEIEAQKLETELANFPDLPKAKDIIGAAIWSESQPLEKPAPQPAPVPTAQVQEVLTQAAPQYVIAAPAQQIIPVPPAPTDFLSRIVAASKPLINVIVAEFRQDIAQEVAKILLPQITGALAPMLESSMQGVKDAIGAQFNPWADQLRPVATPDYLHGAQAASVVTTIAPSDKQIGISPPDKQIGINVQIPVLKPVEKPKKLKIAIIGPRGGQQEQVLRAFPEFDFTFIENGHGIKEAGTHCALFIASNAYLNRANRDTMKAHVSPEKVRFIDGGISTIKRTINVWKATQKI